MLGFSAEEGFHEHLFVLLQQFELTLARSVLINYSPFFQVLDEFKPKTVIQFDLDFLTLKKLGKIDPIARFNEFILIVFVVENAKFVEDADDWQLFFNLFIQLIGIGQFVVLRTIEDCSLEFRIIILDDQS